jgi:pimeloyl-ACP methyl ester carboxylesterase
MERRSSHSRPPSMALLAREVLAFAELGVHYATMPWWGVAPRGDGCPVLVLPGLVQSDFSTRPLRRFLNNRGHVACAWGLGTNSGNTRLVDDHLLARLHALCDEHGRKVSIIGWSMGGLFARNLARIAPHAVRQVITLGSPFAGHPKASNAWRLYEAMSGQRASDPRIAERFRGALPVPATSIYSRSDGIVAWQCCLNEVGPQAENIEVISSHCGMGHHPAVLYAVADRLAQPEGQWQPFEATGMLQWMYPARDADPSSRAAARGRARQFGGERT